MLSQETAVVSLKYTPANRQNTTQYNFDLFFQMFKTNVQSLTLVTYIAEQFSTSKV